MHTLCTRTIFPAAAVHSLEQMQCLVPLTLGLFLGNLRRTCLLQHFENEKPNSVNDKKGWSAHPSHLKPGAHKPQEIRPFCVLFATSGATKTQQKVLFYKLCWQNSGVLVDVRCPSIERLRQSISKHLFWLSVLEQETEFCSVAYPDLWSPSKGS